MEIEKEINVLKKSIKELEQLVEELISSLEAQKLRVSNKEKIISQLKEENEKIKNNLDKIELENELAERTLKMRYEIQLKERNDLKSQVQKVATAQEEQRKKTLEEQGEYKALLIEEQNKNFSKLNDENKA